MTTLTPGSYLLDTGIFVLSLRRNQQITARINALQTIYTAPHVISELTYSALRSGNPTRALADVHTIQQKYPTLDIDADIGYLAGQIEFNLRAVGQMIPEGDIWIAATAIGYQLTLVTRDQHFNRIAGLIVEQW